MEQIEEACDAGNLDINDMICFGINLPFSNADTDIINVIISAT